MNRRGAGVFFCLIAALFFCCWNLSAAMFMGGGASWSMDLFAAGLEYTGIFLPVLSVVNLIEMCIRDRYKPVPACLPYKGE